MEQDLGPLYLPAIRGKMGMWIFYTTIMSFEEIVERVKRGKELSNHEELSKMVQREIKKSRAGEIVSYLKSDKERFFPAMIVAVYDGEPKWLDVSIGKRQSKVNLDPSILDGSKSDKLGFLSLSGKERLFPLDGQHRLVGIGDALNSSEPDQLNLSDDEMTVILVSHQDSKEGRIRSRHLFTTLNKKAVSVAKNEIIALDEGDMMAIVTRYLVEGYGPLSGGKVDCRQKTANTPKGNTGKFITIFTIYDSLCDLFRVLTRKSLKQLQTKRLDEEKTTILFDCAKAYFSSLMKNFPDVNDCLCGSGSSDIIRKNRKDDGGHMLFRTVGQRIFSMIVRAAINDEISKIDNQFDLFSKDGFRVANKLISDTVRYFSSIPTDLTCKPYVDLIFDSSSQKIVVSRDKIVRDIILYKYGILNDNQVKKLAERVRNSIGKDSKISDFLW